MLLCGCTPPNAPETHLTVYTLHDVVRTTKAFPDEGLARVRRHDRGRARK